MHRAIEWSQRALDWARSQRGASFDQLLGLPFNIGRIEGGIKGNVIAPSCDLRFGFRPLPGQSVDDLLAMFRGMASPRDLSALEELFRGPPLPAGDGADASRQLLQAQALAQRLGLPTGAAVNFWTEASLFSRAGCTALVYGPGDIAQAHAANEWVALAELSEVAAQYLRLIDA